jgi:thioredoxin reductase (NADPH)
MTQHGNQQTDRDVYDITIIGAGPTGLFATFYAGLRQMKTKLIEALPEVGGQLAVLYPEKFIYDVFRAHEGGVAELFASGIPIRLFWELKEVHSDDRLEGATIVSNKTGQEEFLPVDAILVNIGFKADLGPIKDWGLKIDKRAIVVNGRMETNLPGVYAAGDISTQPDSVTLNLIATGFAHAAIAVNCAKTYLDPDSKVFPGHSSEMKL